MDGPNVNWAIFKKMQEKITMNFQHQLIDIGSCGLHTLHNSCKTAIDATHWGVSQILSVLHTLLKDTPARREDYEKTTGQSMYSLSFCSHHWVENAALLQYTCIELCKLSTVYTFMILILWMYSCILPSPGIGKLMVS